jgi:putative drug exporter of the RND superfamily
MSHFLYRVGRWSFQRPWVAILGWLALIAAVIALISVNGVTMTSDMSINGTKSQAVLDELAEELPDATGGQGSFVFTVPAGQDISDPERLKVIMGIVDDVYADDHVLGSVDELQAPARQQIDAANAQITQLPEDEQAAATAQMQADMAAKLDAQRSQYGFTPLVVDSVPVPSVLVSADGSTALFQFQFDEQVASLPAGTVDNIIEHAEAHEGQAGLQILPGESLKENEIPLGAGEVIGLVIAGVVLTITLGSLVAGGLPLLTGLVGVGVGVGGAVAVSQWIPLNSVTPVLALMIGLAVGIDYALFIVNRQRHLILKDDLSAEEAASRAVGTAGSSVFFAGLTVIVALCGLTAININLLTTMALVAAITVALAVGVALSLLPALLGLVGERVVSAKSRAAHAARGENPHRVAGAWSRFVDRRRWPVVVGVIALLGIAAVPVTNMNLGMPTGETANLDSTARQSYDVVADSFGEGFNGPLVVTAKSNSHTALTQEEIASITTELSAVKDVHVVQSIGQSQDGSTAVFMVVPDSGPSAEQTKELVHQLRSAELPAAVDNDVTFGVTGFTAITIDMAEKLSDVFPIYMAIIVALSLIILLLVFRSVTVPVLATGGFLLSILATFGLTTLVFQDGWLKAVFGFDSGGPIVPFIPIMVTGILYGLAMDYQVFLTSSMRDHFVRGDAARHAVINGFNATSRVVVAAAVIMVSVFAGFIFTDDIMITQVGFALAVGILIDAFLIRMTLIPALMSILGKGAWWLPGWLDKILPDLDVEGHKLDARLAEQPRELVLTNGHRGLGATNGARHRASQHALHSSSTGAVMTGIPPIRCAPWCADNDGHPRELARTSQTCRGESTEVPMSLEPVKIEADECHQPRVTAAAYRGFNEKPVVHVHVDTVGLSADAEVNLTVAEAMRLAAALSQVADAIDESKRLERHRSG